MKDTNLETAECEVEIAVPDYDTPCMNCGETPTVTTETKEGVQIMHLELCGVCMWGSSSAIYPENW